uniref:StAR related lipid transfer domain containing 4 n=1 Tax=Sarcophilus harrisii TaxID=9305 RepID=A0A7N4V0M0_SARHA
METLTDAPFLATKVKNTLCQYHSIKDDKWRIAKKTKDVTVWRKPSEEFSGYLIAVWCVTRLLVNCLTSLHQESLWISPIQHNMKKGSCHVV